jgi:hypothetical protein
MPKSVRELLDDHISTIMGQMQPLRAQLGLLERELADARKARNAIVHDADQSEASRISSSLAAARIREYLHERSPFPSIKTAVPSSPYEKLTMKQLVRKALNERFQDGATANEMLDFFQNAWGRDDIVRTSLSPQLSRLKREGDIILRGKKWYLAGTNETLALEAPKANEPSNASAEGGS